ncbi:MAG: histidine kinase [Candidatus Coproplasma sp.]
MEDKKKIFEDPSKFTKLINALILVLLIVFEVIVCVQYLYAHSNPWIITALITSTVALTILYVVGIYGAKSLKAKIILYIFDFLLLFAVCAFTGSTYLSALYCIILTQVYINVDGFKTKIAFFAVSCTVFIITSITGWFLNHMRAISYDEIISLVSSSLVGVIILFIHFVVANFLLKFYKLNLKLTVALKEADERKEELKKAYGELSEKAVLEERNRIARDIHDNAGHSMTAVIMQTEAAKLIIDTDPEEAKKKIISANMQAKNALEQMRDSVHLLAGRDTAHTLKEELEEILAQTKDGTGVNIRFSLEEVELPWEERRFIANCLKECLTNGVRHGGANAFYVELTNNEGRVCLTVSDNGKGLPPDYKEGFGIRGMREKATAFGGGVVIESEEDDGCEIKIIVLDGKEADK